LLLAGPDNSPGRLVAYQRVRTPVAARFSAIRAYSARLTSTTVRRWRRSGRASRLPCAP